MSTTPYRRLAAAAAVTALGTAAALAPQTAHAVDPDVVVDGVRAPLSVAVDGNGAIYYTANFRGALFVKADESSDPERLYKSEKGLEVGAVDVVDGHVIFVEGFTLKLRTPEGEVTSLANLRRFEKENNPDGDVTYGVRKIRERCAAKFPEDVPARYKGIVEAHPYATQIVGGTAVVADAAANAILAVDVDTKDVTVLGVTPAVPVEITKRIAKQRGLPDCAVGKKYRFEGVPTDVEYDGVGGLVYTSLPGGEMPGTGSVRSMDPDTGSSTTIEGGFSGATGLALDENGDIYVSELFTNTITKIPAGGEPSAFWQGPPGPPGPAALEIDGNELIATIDVLAGPAGKVVSFPLSTRVE